MSKFHSNSVQETSRMSKPIQFIISQYIDEEMLVYINYKTDVFQNKKS